MITYIKSNCGKFKRFCQEEHDIKTLAIFYYENILSPPFQNYYINSSQNSVDAIIKCLNIVEWHNYNKIMIYTNNTEDDLNTLIKWCKEHNNNSIEMVLYMKDDEG